MTDLAKLSPVEIDTELARLWGDTNATEATIARLEATVAEIESGRWGRNLYRRTSAEINEDIAALTAKLADLRAEAAPFELEYENRGRWNRYFLVTNGNGHVHRGMDCSTCYPTTQYAWLIDLADCDEDAMIEEWGEKACTVCFPTAPVNPFYHRPSRLDREARELRDAEKARKAADKDAKAITAPDGGELRIPDGSYTNYRTGAVEKRYETIRTKVAASRALSAAIKDYGWYGPGHPSDFGAKIPVLVEALEAAGIETAPIIARAKKAVVKDGGKYLWNG